MKIALIHSSLLPLALLASACTDESTDPGALEFRTSWYCDTCGVGNSPRINDATFPELNLDGEPNSDGVTLHGILSPTDVLHTLDVVDDDFVARNGEGTIVATGPALVGWKLWLKLPDDANLHVTIHAFDPALSSWATNAAPVSGYALAYIDPVTQQPTHVCPESGGDTNDPSVTLIGGETYDRELKLVNPNMTGWFTLACRDEAIYKMKRMNYGPNDQFAGTSQPATVDQRQATLKMITADYCGTGHSYTAQGQPIYWRNASSTVNNKPPSANATATLEARWTANGATCLTEPRYASLDDVACSLPVCSPAPNEPHEWTTWTP